jgi:hypothetical protein
MIVARIAGATTTLGAPKGWDTERDGNCRSLPIRVIDGCYQSAWEPTPEELLMLNAGGSSCSRSSAVSLP